MNNSLWLILLLLSSGNCGNNCGGGAMTIPAPQPSPWCNQNSCNQNPCNQNPCNQCNPCMPQAPAPQIPSFPCEQQPMIIPSYPNTGSNNCEWMIILLLLFCGHPTMPLSNNYARNNFCC